MVPSLCSSVSLSGCVCKVKLRVSFTDSSTSSTSPYSVNDSVPVLVNEIRQTSPTRT